MDSISIDKLVDEKKDSIDSEKLRMFLRQKLQELYKKEKDTNLFDYDDIRYSAMIDLIYEIIPSLRAEIILNE